MTRAELDRVVAGTDKRRFEVSGGRIRAAQGHSVDVDARSWTPVGRRRRAVPRHGGPLRGRRSGPTGCARASAVTYTCRPTPPTAMTVGARRGEPVILSIDAAGMHSDGHEFYLAANGVWLTDHVPPRWITEP